VESLCEFCVPSTFEGANEAVENAFVGQDVDKLAIRLGTHEQLPTLIDNRLIGHTIYSYILEPVAANNSTKELALDIGQHRVGWRCDGGRRARGARELIGTERVLTHELLGSYLKRVGSRCDS
jgi:hypothetical protein